MTVDVRRQLAARIGLAFQGLALAMSATGLVLMMLVRFPNVIGVSMAVVFILVDVGTIGSTSRARLFGAVAIKALTLILLSGVQVLIIGGPARDPDQTASMLASVGYVLVYSGIVPSAIAALLRSVSRGR